MGGVGLGEVLGEFVPGGCVAVVGVVGVQVTVNDLLFCGVGVR